MTFDSTVLYYGGGTSGKRKTLKFCWVDERKTSLLTLTGFIGIKYLNIFCYFFSKDIFSIIKLFFNRMSIK